MEPIKNFELLSFAEKAKLKLINFLSIKLGTWGISGAVALGGGLATQSAVRIKYNYDQVEHALLKEEMEQPRTSTFEDFKKDRKEGTRKAISNLGKKLLSQGKEAVAHPKEYIKNTDMYKTLRLNYLNSFEVIDDASLFLPMILIYMALAGYINRKLAHIKGDVVIKEQFRQIAEKMNEIIDVFNPIADRIQSQGIESLSPEEVAEVRRLLKEIGSALPEGDELDALISESSNKPVDGLK